jgi:hypothetical protein
MGVTHGDLRTEHGGQAELTGRSSETNHTVKTVVVGESEGFKAETTRLLNELLWRARPVKEREV